MRLNKTETLLLASASKGKGTSFTAGLMRKSTGRYSKLYPTNTRLRNAAYSLQAKGLVIVEIIDQGVYDGEHITVYFVSVV